MNNIKCQNQTDVMHELLQRKADVNKRDPDDGQTALHWSAMLNNTDAIRLLLGKGASTTIKDKKGRTPIDVAREEKSQEAVPRFTFVVILMMNE